ncbi:T9SS type A sorting domain-containing protein [Flavobacterium fluviatile]|uniref:T9SS type A sorting domain-containing protein n=1 Tax=Flavobacterium fluviatile TaxID=1862387 RepID=UPI001FCAB56E|nr:T9SS type A sorting domain-containing protein [Flavobacterium fluviatile]
MSKFITLLMLLCCFLCQSQAADRIIFSYDNAGNQIQRLLCINCATTSKMSKKITALEEEDLQKFSSQDVISYYPNPVKEELYLQWELIDENYVSSIKVFSLNGQVLQSISNLNKKNNQNVAFQSYPTGMYFVQLQYKNGDEKTIKIVKK